MSPPFLLEFLNGSSLTPDLIWLVMLAMYLSREARRRGLHRLDWLHLPPSMNLILAVFICDAGNCLRSITIWAWRVAGAGEFNALHYGSLIVAGALITIGGLCKVRAWTSPDYGEAPWAASVALTSVVAVALLSAMLAIR